MLDCLAMMINATLAIGFVALVLAEISQDWRAAVIAVLASLTPVVIMIAGHQRE